MMNLNSMLKVIFLLVFSANLFAGTIIKTKSINTEFGEKIETLETTYIQDGKLRIESSDENGRSVTIIDSKNKIIINMDMLDSSYVVITEEDFGRFAEMINAKKNEMLAQFPEEQREAMRAMIEQQMEQVKNEPKIEYIKIKSENFNEYNCEVYKGIKMGEKVEELWITPWQNIELMNEYKKISLNLKKLFQKVADGLGEYGKLIEDEFDFEMIDKGFPVKTIEYEDGVATTIETLEKVIQKNLSPSLFKVPNGMIKKDFIEM